MAHKIYYVNLDVPRSGSLEYLAATWPGLHSPMMPPALRAAAYPHAMQPYFVCVDIRDNSSRTHLVILVFVAVVSSIGLVVDPNGADIDLSIRIYSGLNRTVLAESSRTMKAGSIRPQRKENTVSERFTLPSNDISSDLKPETNDIPVESIRATNIVSDCKTGSSGFVPFAHARTTVANAANSVFHTACPFETVQFTDKAICY